MRRVSERLARTLACAALLAAALPPAAPAASLDDYLSAKATATAAAQAAAKAGKSEDDDVVAKEEAALGDLEARMEALVGLRKLKDLGAPAYTLEYLIDGDALPNGTLDGMAYANADGTTRIVVTPEPLFRDWLAARAKDAHAPAALREGLKAAAGNYYFVNNAAINTSGGFEGYIALPVTAVPGEEAYATLGFYGDEVPGNNPPNTIAIVRVADGRAMVGITDVELDVPPLPDCDAIWAPYAMKGDALSAVVTKDNKEDDPRWDQVADIYDEGSEAYRTCFAQAAPGKPFFAEAARKAEDFLKAARGN